jgi:hypothetical protein
MKKRVSKMKNVAKVLKRRFGTAENRNIVL